jgi:hypothetical protein
LLDPLDIPNISAAKITSGQGTLSTTTTGVTVGSGSNALLSNATVNIQNATTAQPGLLTSADWNTFNGKEPAIATDTATKVWHGNKTWSAVSLTADVTNTLPVGNGGLGIASGTSGGILGFTGSTTLASSGALTANQLIIGGGAGATPSTLAAGSQYQVLRMGAANPAYGSVNLDQAAAVTGALPLGNGGTGQVTANAALNALLPSQGGNATKVLQTDGSNTSWAASGSGGSSGVNILQNYNPEFESGTTNWTATPALGTATSTDILFDTASVTWDSASAGQSVCSNLTAIPEGLKGTSGLGYIWVKVPSGTATHTISVSDGTNTIASNSIVSTSSATRQVVNFIFPTSGSLKLCINSVASNEPSIDLDKAYLGEATNISIAKPPDTFSAKVSSAGVVSAENVDFINGNCSLSTATFTCTFNSGIFSVAPNCYIVGTGGNMNSNNVTTQSSTQLIYITATSGANAASGVNIFCQKTGADFSQTQVATNYNTIPGSWAGYHDSTCAWARTNAAYGDPTADASCVLTELTNNNFGTVSTYTVTNAEPGLTFTPKYAGRILVCYDTVLQGGANSQILGVQLTDGTTVLSQKLAKLPASASADFYSVGGCTIKYATTATSTTLRLESKASSGTVTITGNATDRAVNWTLVNLDQPITSPVFVGSITSNTTGSERHERAQVTSVTTTAVNSQSGTWIASVTDNGSGDTTLNLTAGLFTSAPTCICSVNTAASGQTCGIDTVTPPTTSLVRVKTWNGATLTDMVFNIACDGPK